MDKEQFEEIVTQGIDSIPQEFLEKLNNVAITIEEEPTTAQIHKLRLGHGVTLFGLYEGIALTKRTANYGSVLPDKISIFQGPIIRASRDIEDVKEIVKNTVWHEIAHHFGMNEAEVRASEVRRREKLMQEE